MLIEEEHKTLNQYLLNCLSDESNQIGSDIIDYLNSKSKKIRPRLVFLFAKALGLEIDEKIYNLACSIELIHNSTLIHDDILDDADIRRGNVSLNRKLGNNLSVLAGDILLSIALKELIKCNNLEVINTFAQSIYLMCKGEINQNFTIDNLPSLNEYIKKSEYKTAELFKASLCSLCLIKKPIEKEHLINFATNFGIAFQLKDDLLNILQSDKTKPTLSDIHNGIFTAPVIFLNENENIENLNKDDIIELILKDNKYIKKTIELIKEYVDKAIEAITFIEDNQYKQEIITIAQNLYKAGINE